MAVIVDGQFCEDPWRRISEQERDKLSDWVIVDLVWLGSILSADRTIDLPVNLGVAIPGNSQTDAVPVECLSRLMLIEIVFSGMTDGCGFSLAQQFRQVGYRGHLRASGSLIPDQYPLLEECGFGSVSVPDEVLQRHGEATWRAARVLRPRHDPRGIFAPAAGDVADRNRAA